MSEQDLSKPQLRKIQAQKIEEFFQRKDAAELITNLESRLYTDPDYLNSQIVGITLSMPGELDTSPIIKHSLQNDKQVVVPRTLPHRQMEFVLLEEDTYLSQTPFGTREPVGGEIIDKTDIDALIVPGLAFSKNHYRVGFGGGFYDRYLADFVGKSISLALPPQLYERPRWPVEPHDILIDKIIY
ncbi:5-formyltetrahydrofolate cyclo-ligase [Lentilactobacillus sp. IMAU92037]|uniref:5-formyltetrahydrofolate cyclo-ligase n=1 Tax=Lentilactobacillus dabitei TaxID=2831523 RepID=UPI001C263B59|nr:5-formyltetrahydrofolate cyclo-ligase [Lentilactobacillus dabitei]MBV0931077.1 5-formyltetrahydrofolate cyclo-ligase [Lentilactobacillus dabitei]